MLFDIWSNGMKSTFAVAQITAAQQTVCSDEYI